MIGSFLALIKRRLANQPPPIAAKAIGVKLKGKEDKKGANAGDDIVSELATKSAALVSSVPPYFVVYRASTTWRKRSVMGSEALMLCMLVL